MFVENGLKLLVFSPPGHGKTYFIGTAVDDERFWPILLADFEAGLKSIQSRVRNLVLPTQKNPLKLPVLGEVKPVKGKVDVVRIQEWRDFDSLYEYLSDESSPYRTIALDSLSEMAYLNMSEALAEALKADPKHDPDIAEQRDYLRSYSQMRKLVRFFRDLPLHVIFSAGAQTLQDPRTKLNQMYPQLTGKLAYEIPGLVDIMGYLAVVEEGDEIYRCLFTQPTERFVAKDRSEGGKLGMYIKDPTLPRIMDLLEGKIERREL